MTVNSGISLGSCMRHSGQRHIVSRGTSLNTDLLFLVRAAGEACCCAHNDKASWRRIISYHITQDSRKMRLLHCLFCRVRDE